MAPAIQTRTLLESLLVSREKEPEIVNWQGLDPEDRHWSSTAARLLACLCICQWPRVYMQCIGSVYRSNIIGSGYCTQFGRCSGGGLQTRVSVKVEGLVCGINDELSPVTAWRMNAGDRSDSYTRSCTVHVLYQHLRKVMAAGRHASEDIYSTTCDECCTLSAILCIFYYGFEAERPTHVHWVLL